MCVAAHLIEFQSSSSPEGGRTRTEAENRYNNQSSISMREKRRSLKAKLPKKEEERKANIYRMPNL